MKNTPHNHQNKNHPYPNIQKEYEKWTYLLLSIVGDRTSNENVHVDLGTPIQKRLQKIEDLQSENFKIKQQIINQINQNNLLSQQIKQKKNEIAIIAKESDEKGSKLQKEKQTLLNNIQTFAHEIDEEMRSIINSCYEKSKKILKDNQKLLKLIAETLLEEETITKEQIDSLVENGKLDKEETKKPKDSDDKKSFRRNKGQS